MPAVVKCPTGCRLRVPARKLLDTIRCPKCNTSIFFSKDQIEKFQADQKHVLQGIQSSELVEVASEEIVFLEGEANQLLVEVNDDTQTAESSSKKDASPPQDALPNLPANPRPAPPPLANQASSQPLPPQIEQPARQAPIPPTPATQPTPAPPHQANAGNRMTNPAPTDHLGSVDKTLEDEASEIDRLEQKLAAEKSKRESLSSLGLQYFSKWFVHAENPGVVHNKEIRWKAYSLAWAMLVIGLFLLGPVGYTMLQWIGKDYHMPLGRWSLLLLFFSSFQFLYAMFLAQIPDWTTTRFISYLMLVMTVFSSFTLAIALLSQDGNGLFNFLQLSMMDKGKVVGWLCIMSIIFGMMSYLCGRTTQLWMDEEARRALVM